MKEVIKKINNLIELNEALARATGSPVYTGIATGLETAKALVEKELNERSLKGSSNE